MRIYVMKDSAFCCDPLIFFMFPSTDVVRTLLPPGFACLLEGGNTLQEMLQAGLEHKLLHATTRHTDTHRQTH